MWHNKNSVGKKKKSQQQRRSNKSLKKKIGSTKPIIFDANLLESLILASSFDIITNSPASIFFALLSFFLVVLLFAEWLRNSPTRV